MDENDAKLRERVTRVETDLANEVKAREKLEAAVEDMRDIVSEIRHLRLDFNKMTEEVSELKEKPVKRWESVIAAIIGAVAGGIGTALIHLLIGG